MAELGNNITITLPAFDMMNMLAMAEAVFMIAGFPNPETKESFEQFKMQVFMNASAEALEEAMSNLRVKEMMRDIEKNQN
jgi:hypothetical protein